MSRLLTISARFVLIAMGGAIAVGMAGVAGGSDLRGSDRFWRLLYFEGVESEHYEDLKEITAASDSIVVGTIQSVSPSRWWIAAPELGDDGVAYYVKASVQVDAVLSDSIEFYELGTIALELFLPNWTQYPELAPAVPSVRTIFFLRRKLDTALPYYRLTTVVQGYFRDHGHAEPPIGADDPWVLALHDRTFDSVIEQVKQGG